MSLDRRTLIAGAAGLGSLMTLSPLVRAAEALKNLDLQRAEARKQQDAAHEALMRVPGLMMHGKERVAMLVYPGFTALDLVGPHYFLACMMGATVQLVARTLEPIHSDLKLAVMPDATFETAMKDVDVLFVPGGTQGTIDAARDPATIAFVQSRAATARYVSSVCTGAVILAAAGLLKGRKATAHWVVRDALADFGATPVDQRVVFDGKIITGAGVSAGLDLGLALVAAIRGRSYAEALQLQAEYAPQPPFDAGTLERAPPDIASSMSGMFEPVRFETRAIAVEQRGRRS